MGKYTAIDDSSAHFQIATWTGNTSAPRSITNDGNKIPFVPVPVGTA